MSFNILFQVRGLVASVKLNTLLIKFFSFIGLFFFFLSQVLWQNIIGNSLFLWVNECVTFSINYIKICTSGLRFWFFSNLFFVNMVSDADEVVFKVVSFLKNFLVWETAKISQRCQQFPRKMKSRAFLKSRRAGDFPWLQWVWLPATFIGK